MFITHKYDIEMMSLCLKEKEDDMPSSPCFSREKRLLFYFSTQGSASDVLASAVAVVLSFASSVSSVSDTTP